MKEICSVCKIVKTAFKLGSKESKFERVVEFEYLGVLISTKNAENIIKTSIKSRK